MTNNVTTYLGSGKVRTTIGRGGDKEGRLASELHCMISSFSKVLKNIGQLLVQDCELVVVVSETNKSWLTGRAFLQVGKI